MSDALQLIDELDDVSNVIVELVDDSAVGEDEASEHQAQLEDCLAKRQGILDRLQKTDTSTLTDTCREAMARRLSEVIEKDKAAVVKIRKILKTIEKSSSTLAVARRAVTGYRPVPSDDARPLRSIV